MTGFALDSLRGAPSKGKALLLWGVAALALAGVVSILETFGFGSQGSTALGLPVLSAFRNFVLYPVGFVLAGLGAYRLGARDAGSGGNEKDPALQALEAYWRKVVELSPDAIFLHDGENILFANPAMLRMVGAEAPDDIVGKPAIDVLNPESQEKVNRFREKILETGEALAFEEMQFQSLDGRTIWVSSGAAPLAVGGHTYFLIVAHDINARKKAEEAERNARLQLRRVTDAVPAAIVYVDRDHKIGFINRGYKDLMGLEETDLIGKHLREVRDEGSYRETLPYIKRALSGEELVYEVERTTRGGKRAFIRSHYVPHFAEDGAVLGYYALLVDVTAERDAQQALHVSETKFVKAFNASPAGLLIVREADNVIVDANDRYLRAVGLTRSQAIGKPIQRSVSWLEPEERQRYLDLVAKHGEVSDFAADVRTYNGKVVHILLSASRLEIDGEPCILHLTRDVTEHRRAEAALRVSETRFKDFVGSASDWLWETDADLKLTWVSEGYWQNSDLSAKDVFGKRPWEIGEIRVGEVAGLRIIRNYMEKRQPFSSMQLTRTDADGRVFHRSMSGWPVFGESGEFQGYRGTLTDITAQVELEYGYRRLVEDAPFSILVKGDEKVLFANAAAARLYRANSPRDLIGLPIRSLLHPDELQRYEERDRQLKEDGGALGAIEQRRVALDGSVVTVESAGISIVWQGQPAILGVQTDVSDRRAAIDALHKNEARLRQIIDAVPHMICARDADGRVILANRAMADAYGLQVKHLIGLKLSELHLGDDKMQDFLSSGAEVIKSGEPATFLDLKFSTVDGDARYIDVVKVPYTPPERDQTAVLCVATDVTERRLAEDKLRQAQKMEAVGQLTGGIAHDFNNLLAVIMGNLQLLEDRVESDAQSKKLAGAAVTAARRGAALTRQLLSFSRKQPLQLQHLDINEFMGDIHDLLSRSIGEIHTLRVHAGEGLWTTRVDPAQMQTALLNLVINASHAMPSGGDIVVETANVSVRGGGGHPAQLGPGDYVSISVTDTGSGMSPDVVGRAFDPFFTTKEVGAGTGLGLSMVYSFAQQSNGTVNIDSKPDQGARVTLFLPRDDALPADPAPASESAEDEADEMPAARSDRSETVLVVEDDKDVRDIAVEFLTGMGYRVLEAEDGPSAIRVFEDADRVDVLFTDVVLPHGMTGLQVARELCGRRPGLKVLITSGNMEPKSASAGDQMPAYMFLRKPYLATELAHQMRILLDDLDKENA